MLKVQILHKRQLRVISKPRAFVVPTHNVSLGVVQGPGNGEINLSNETDEII